MTYQKVTTRNKFIISRINCANYFLHITNNTVFDTHKQNSKILPSFLKHKKEYLKLHNNYNIQKKFLIMILGLISYLAKLLCIKLIKI